MKEAYTVKYWFTNDKGYREQKEEIVLAEDHDDAARIIISENAVYLKIEIVSVIYQ